MICYLCEEKGRTTPAVAICIVCGMGVCREHLVRDDQPIEDVINWGFIEEQLVYPRKLPRILCLLCHEALNQRSGIRKEDL